jgi:hypothetical protein
MSTLKRRRKKKKRKERRYRYEHSEEEKKKKEEKRKKKEKKKERKRERGGEDGMEGPVPKADSMMINHSNMCRRVPREAVDMHHDTPSTTHLNDTIRQRTMRHVDHGVRARP